MAQLGPERGSLAAQTQAAFRAANFAPVIPEGRASWASRERRWAVNRFRAVRGGSDVRQTHFRPECHVITLASGTAVSAARKPQSPRPSPRLAGTTIEPPRKRLPAAAAVLWPTRTTQRRPGVQ